MVAYNKKNFSYFIGIKMHYGGALGWKHLVIWAVL